MFWSLKLASYLFLLCFAIKKCCCASVKTRTNVGFVSTSSDLTVLLMGSAARELRNRNSQMMISVLTHERFGKSLLGLIYQNETMYFSNRESEKTVNNSEENKSSDYINAHDSKQIIPTEENNYANETQYLMHNANFTRFDLLVIDRQATRFVINIIVCLINLFLFLVPLTSQLITISLSSSSTMNRN